MATLTFKYRVNLDTTIEDKLGRALKDTAHEVHTLNGSPDERLAVVSYPNEKDARIIADGLVRFGRSIDWIAIDGKRVGILQTGYDVVIRGLKEGKRYARAGWNGKDMFIFLVKGSRFIVNREPLMSILGDGAEVDYHAHIDMRTAQGSIVPWLCSQTDALAEDWVEV